MTADQHAHGVAEGAVVDAALGEGLLGVEPLRVTDGQLEVLGVGKGDQLVGLIQRDGEGLLQQDVLAGLEGRLGDGEPLLLGRGGDEQGLDFGVGDQLLPVRGGGGRVGLCRISASRSGLISARWSEPTSGLLAAATARMPPHHPTPMTPMLSGSMFESFQMSASGAIGSSTGRPVRAEWSIAMVRIRFRCPSRAVA